MTDYFGALLRSAGAVQADAPAPATPTGTADLVEQEVEVEAGPTPASVRASQSPEAPAVVEPTPQLPAESTPQSPVASPKPREVERREPAPSLRTRPAIDDEVHPVVRAALQWVTADPGPVERTPDVAEAAKAQIASDSPSRRPVPQLSTPASRARPPQPARPASQVWHPGERRQERTAAEPPLAAAQELDLTLPRAPRARVESVAATETAALAPQDLVEVSIGTIHVSVDAAPPARTVVHPTPSPPRPQSASPAERGGFARSRLPRI